CGRSSERSERRPAMVLPAGQHDPTNGDHVHFSAASARVSARTVSRTWTGAVLELPGACDPGARFIDPTRRAIKVQRPVCFALKADCATVTASSLEMSAIGPKRTLPLHCRMSAFGGKAGKDGKTNQRVLVVIGKVGSGWQT